MKSVIPGMNSIEKNSRGLFLQEGTKIEDNGTELSLDNRINPDYIRSRPFFPMPGTPLYDNYARGKLELLSPREQLLELKLMVQELDVTSNLCFDHMGNYWRNRDGGLLLSQSYEGYELPTKKPLLLDLIDEGVEAQED